MKKFFKKKEKLEDIKERITNLSYNKDEDYGILPPPISNGTFVNEIIRYFLGEDWYTIGSIHNDQVNYEALVEIEYRYRNIKK